MSTRVELAAKKLAEGLPVLIHDSSDREDEVDIVYKADVVTPDTIKFIRKVAGGLICFVMRYEHGRVLGLDLQTRLLQRVDLGGLVKRPCYGDEPAFSIWVNHVSVRTGIRDVDRAKTVRELYNVVKLIEEGHVEEARSKFYTEFYSPGHVPVLLGRVGARRGHTELSLMLAEIAGVTPALVICELLGDSLEAMPVQEAADLAAKLGTVLVSGNEIEEYYRRVVRK